MKIRKLLPLAVGLLCFSLNDVTAHAAPPPPRSKFLPNGQYRPGQDPRCGSPHFFRDHPDYCKGAHPIYKYGTAFFGYYDHGPFGPGYYEPGARSFVFVDAKGHRRSQPGQFKGYGFHGKSAWDRGHH